MKQTQYLSHYIRLFLVNWLPNERGLSENTILSYGDALKLLLKYCADHLNLKIDELPCAGINDITIRDFLGHLEKEKNRSPATRYARLAALKTFFKFPGRENPECLENSRRINAIAQKKVPHKTADYLEPEEFVAIIESIDVTVRNGYRDRALLLLMHNTGARVQETVDIKLDDLRLDSAARVRLVGKGDGERVIPLRKDTVEAIKDYIAVRRPKSENENHLFPNDRGVGITRFGIRHIVTKYTDMATHRQPSLKNKNVGPHTLRHTTAMHLLQAGNELNVVRLWLGHASLNTTHMYVEIDMEMKREIPNKARPIEFKRQKEKWKNPEILEWPDELCKEEIELCAV